MKKFDELITEVATPFASDKYYDLPGPIASWIDKYGRKKVQVADDGTHWILQIKGSLNGADLFALSRLDSVTAIGKNKLQIEVRK